MCKSTMNKNGTPKSKQKDPMSAMALFREMPVSRVEEVGTVNLNIEMSLLF